MTRNPARLRFAPEFAARAPESANPLDGETITVEIEKAPELIELLRFLERRIGGSVLEPVDHWDADLCAIGVRRRGDVGRLAYVSVFREAESGVFVSLEDEATQRSVDHRGLSRDEVLEVVARHLGLSVLPS